MDEQAVAVAWGQEVLPKIAWDCVGECVLITAQHWQGAEMVLSRLALKP